MKYEIKWFEEKRVIIEENDDIQAYNEWMKKIKDGENLGKVTNVKYLSIEKMED